MDYHVEEFNLNAEFLKKIIKSNILLYCVVLLLALRIVGAVVSINFPYNVFFADITKATLENLVNQTRQSAGLPALVENEKLNQAAMLKAENMVQNQYFNHTSPSGVTPWYWFSQAGYNYKYAGENLAVGFFESEEVYQAWLNSPTHKENIINPNYKEIGTAVLKGFGDGNAIIVVQLFGTQKTVAVKPTETVQTTPDVSVPATTSSEPIASGIKIEPEVEVKVETVKPAVLSQTTQIVEAINTASDNVQSKMINYVIYNYNDFLENTVYGITLVMIGVLLAIIFLSQDFNLSRQLVYRSVLIMVLLSAAILVNKDILISLIPHKIII